MKDKKLLRLWNKMKDKKIGAKIHKKNARPNICIMQVQEGRT